MSLSGFLLMLKGGAGSGNHGHGGRLGKRGGSTSSGNSKEMALQKLSQLPIEENEFIPGGTVYPGDIFPNQPLGVVIGMKQSDLNKYVEKEVSIKDIIPTQDNIPYEGVKAYINNLPEKLVELGIIKNLDNRLENKFVVIGGHTRLASMILQGKDIVNAKIYEWDANTQKWSKPK